MSIFPRAVVMNEYRRVGGWSHREGEAGNSLSHGSGIQGQGHTPPEGSRGESFLDP